MIARKQDKTQYVEYLEAGVEVGRGQSRSLLQTDVNPGLPRGVLSARFLAKLRNNIATSCIQLMSPWNFIFTNSSSHTS